MDGGGTDAAEARPALAGFWPKARRSLGRAPFLEDAIAAYYCASDPKTPARVRAAILAAIAYFIVPLDMIPDFIAGLGFTDDAAVLYAVLRTVSAHVSGRHRAKAAAAMARLRG